jgi:glycosyltransferase involved in cell wall biosynthesis
MLAKSSVLVVIPAFNEEGAIGGVLEKLRETNQTVLVVSDGSTDSTARIAREFGVQLLDLPYNLGVGGALRAGFKYAVAYNYEAVVQIDADGQHPVVAIDQLIAAIDLSLPEGERNRAMLETLYSCGLRVTELINLKLSYLYKEEGFIKVLGKGNK